MKIPKSNILSRKRSIPELNFADQEMTSFAGLVVYLSFFQSFELSSKLQKACSSLSGKFNRQHSHSKILECLIVHLLIGYRNLRDQEFYKDDPLVGRSLNLQSLPSVPTISRMMSEFDDEAISSLHDLNSDTVLDRLRQLKIRRITLDFDGSVLSTSRHSEGTAVGFNKKKKGLRSYYPLFCTIAQTSQILRFLHRPGNVHDSNGSIEFVTHCIKLIREALPGVIIEIRMDSAFFNDEMVTLLEEFGTQYTISVPFERFTKLKGIIESRKRWAKSTNGKGKRIGYFEKKWKPDSWDRKYRFLFIRTPKKKQQKGPIQLDLFEPIDEENEYKVVITNKKGRAGNVVSYHEGRGSQEKIFGETKTQLQMDYIPFRKKVANEAFLLCSMLTHNLNRELQMQVKEPERETTRQRQTLWIFEEMKTIRHKIIQTAGRLTRPGGKSTLTMAKNSAIEREISRLMPV